MKAFVKFTGFIIAIIALLAVTTPVFAGPKGTITFPAEKPTSAGYDVVLGVDVAVVLATDGNPGHGAYKSTVDENWILSGNSLEGATVYAMNRGNQWCGGKSAPDVDVSCAVGQATITNGCATVHIKWTIKDRASYETPAWLVESADKKWRGWFLPGKDPMLLAKTGIGEMITLYVADMDNGFSYSNQHGRNLVAQQE